MRRHLCVLLAQVAALSVALGAEGPCEERGAPEEGVGGWSEGKRVAFNAWGGKRQGAVEWNKGRTGAPADEADKRVAFNAWGGKRSQFSAWGGKRGPQPDPRAFFPWGGKRDGSEEEGTPEEDEGQRGGLEWGQPEEATGSSREGGEAAWGRPRGRRSSPRSQQTASAPMAGDAASWERKRLAALWRAAKLQPARQNRRAVGADFFPWGGKRAGPPA